MHSLAQYKPGSHEGSRAGYVLLEFFCVMMSPPPPPPTHWLFFDHTLQVYSINFNSSFRNPKKVVEVEEYNTNITSFLYPDDVYTYSNKKMKQVKWLVWSYM